MSADSYLSRLVLSNFINHILNTYYLDLLDPFLGTNKLVQDGAHPNNEGHQTTTERLSEAFRAYANSNYSICAKTK